MRVIALGLMLAVVTSYTTAEQRNACVRPRTDSPRYTYVDHFDVREEKCCQLCYESPGCAGFAYRGGGQCRSRCSLKRKVDLDTTTTDSRFTLGVLLISSNTSCPDGLSVMKCGPKTDVNECVVCSNLCLPGGRCVNNPFGSNFCRCNTGYYEKSVGVCEDIDECENPHRCINGFCVNTPGSFKCICKPGFAQNENGACVDVNECTRGGVCTGGKCMNIYGSHSCSCPRCRRVQRCPVGGTCSFTTQPFIFSGPNLICEGSSCSYVHPANGLPVPISVDCPGGISVNGNRHTASFLTLFCARNNLVANVETTQIEGVDTVVCCSSCGTCSSLSSPVVQVYDSGVRNEDILDCYFVTCIPQLLSMLTVTNLETGTIADLDVTINIQHPDVGDLKITLIAPDSTSAVLVENTGGNNDNFFCTTFDQAASLSIQDLAAQAPYTGRFRPKENLGVFIGKPIAGSWTLFIEDLGWGGSGFLVSWSLEAQLTYSLRDPLPLSDEAVVLSDESCSDAVEGLAIDVQGDETFFLGGNQKFKYSIAGYEKALTDLDGVMKHGHTGAKTTHDFMTSLFYYFYDELYPAKQSGEEHPNPDSEVIVRLTDCYTEEFVAALEIQATQQFPGNCIDAAKIADTRDVLSTRSTMQILKVIGHEYEHYVDFKERNKYFDCQPCAPVDVDPNLTCQ